MDSVNQFLVEQWDNSWDGQGWFASWTKALGDLTAIQAAWVPPTGGHSIWQIVNHVTFWRTVTINRAEKLPVPDEAECNRRNWEEPVEISEDAWSTAKDALQDTQRAIRPILAGEKPGFDQVKPHVAHDAYHLGQIMNVRAMQKMKPLV